MMKGRPSLASMLGTLAVLGSTAGLVYANHVRIDVVPAPTPLYAPAPLPQQTLQVDEIKAHQVRAQTIYANRIDADQIQGLIHQTSNFRIRNAEGEIRAPEVAASVIYAERITANTVVADAVYVKDLRLK